MREDWNFYALFGLIVLLHLRLNVHSRHLRLHDEILLGDADRAASEALGG